MKNTPVIYENDEILILNKPAGLAVQGGQGVSLSLDTGLARETGRPVYLVHRLDKDTAGLMIVAKTPEAAAEWTRRIASRLVSREYTAVCVGEPERAAGVIRADIVRRGVRKSAVTRYEVTERRSVVLGGEAAVLSVVRLRLETGRTHQIRIHTAMSGFPVAGDDLYGNFRLNRLLKKEYGVRRLMLCATRLDARGFGDDLSFEIPLPPHMELRKRDAM